MDIYVNGQARRLPEPPVLSVVLLEVQRPGQRIAVELNGEVVPRSLYGATGLAAGDRLEIVVAVGGG